jgi:hypothetical protein
MRALLVLIGLVVASPPLYFERVVTQADLEGRSADELRSMRDTIFTRAGHAFDDPAVRDYFSRSPWDRPRKGLSRKLSLIDQKNLVGIALWEKRARALEGLHKLVPGFDKVAAGRPGQECGADDRGVMRDKREERRLLVVAHRLSWDDPTYGPANLGPLRTKMETVRVSCGPDLDADGVREAIILVTARWEMERGDAGVVPESRDFIFLASRRNAKWRALSPLAISGDELGVEGSVRSSAWFVTLADGRKAVAVTRTVDSGGDCEIEFVETRVATLAQGKLEPVGTFETGRPVECQYAEPADWDLFLRRQNLSDMPAMP